MRSNDTNLRRAYDAKFQREHKTKLNQLWQIKDYEDHIVVNFYGFFLFHFSKQQNWGFLIKFLSWIEVLPLFCHYYELVSLCSSFLTIATMFEIRTSICSSEFALENTFATSAMSTVAIFNSLSTYLEAFWFSCVFMEFILH